MSRQKRTDIFYDCEFIDNGFTIEPISIGMICGSKTYYAVNGQLDMWALKENAFLVREVLPHLPLVEGTEDCIDYNHPDVKSLKEIAKGVKEFVTSVSNPRLISWYADYDHVMLAQLYGPMMMLPPGFPMTTYDLKQECERLGDPEVPAQEGIKHNALADAHYHKRIFDFLKGLDAKDKVEKAKKTLAAYGSVQVFPDGDYVRISP
jgi:3' exoribonuclease, RNase T-like